MKAENETTGHNRVIHITDIPDPEGKGYLPKLTITVGYANTEDQGGRTYKAITLDNVIIPAIMEAINRPPARFYHACFNWEFGSYEAYGCTKEEAIDLLLQKFQQHAIESGGGWIYPLNEDIEVFEVSVGQAIRHQPPQIG